MVELYNTTWMNETLSPLSIVNGIGTSIGQPYLIGDLILVSFFLIFLVFAFRHDFLEVILIDCFITTILAVMFAVAGMISFVHISFPAVLFFLVLIIYFYS